MGKCKKGDTLLEYIIRYDKEFIPPEPPPEEVGYVKRNYHIEDWWFIGLETFEIIEAEVAGQIISMVIKQEYSFRYGKTQNQKFLLNG